MSRFLNQKAFTEYEASIVRNDLKTAKEIITSNVSDTAIIYKYCSGFRRDFVTVKKREIWLNNAALFNDPYDCAYLVSKMSKDKYSDDEREMAYNEYLQQVVQDKESLEKQNKTFVSCFSENNESNSMWGYYGNSHKGICIGYSLKEAVKIFNCFPVIYKNEIPILRSEEDISAMLIKSTMWSQENEWRIIKQNDKFRGKGGYHINFMIPKEIYLGCRQEEAYQEDAEIREYIRLLNCENEKIDRKNIKYQNNTDHIIELKSKLSIALKDLMDFCKENRIQLYKFKRNASSFKMKKLTYKL